jgi:hypothetical protein
VLHGVGIHRYPIRKEGGVIRAPKPKKRFSIEFEDIMVNQIKLLAMQTHQIERHFLSTLSKKIGLLCWCTYHTTEVFFGRKAGHTGQIQDKYRTNRTKVANLLNLPAHCHNCVTLPLSAATKNNIVVVSTIYVSTIYYFLL